MGLDTRVLKSHVDWSFHILIRTYEIYEGAELACGISIEYSIVCTHD